MYNPDIKPTFIPDLCTIMYDTKHKDFKGEPSSYRVTGYLKAVAKVFTPRKEAQSWENDMMKKLFYEWHPNWVNEYNLVPCLKEEATHLMGVGVCGSTACLTDERYIFSNEYVSWDEDTIKSENNRWVENLPSLLNRMSVAHCIVGIKHTKKYLKVRSFEGKLYNEIKSEYDNKRR